MGTTEEQRDLTTHLAAERTFLAWIRTGVACMGFGFLVARFVEDSSSSSPLWLGATLIIAGVLMSLISARHHAKLVGTLNRGERPPSRPSNQAIILALLLAAIGLAMIYLIFVEYRHGFVEPGSGSKGSVSISP